MAGASEGEVLPQQALDNMQTKLNAAREAICRELADIPPPVPVCDVHFNRLLEDRARVVDALQSLARLRASQAGRAERHELLAFRRACCGLDARSKSSIEAALDLLVWESPDVSS